MATVRFGDVAERVNTKEDRLNTDLVYYVGGEHIESNALTVSGRGKIKEADLGPMFYFGFKPGDILFVTRNPHLRKCATVDFSGICSEKTLVIGTKVEDVLSQKYLATVMQSDDFWEFMEENKSGSVNYFINWSTLADYEFDLPPIERQRELANLLWAANDLKESYKKAITATDEMLKAKFREMFGEAGDTSRGAAEPRSKWPVVDFQDVCIRGPQNGFYKKGIETAGNVRVLKMTQLFAHACIEDVSECDKWAVDGADIKKFRLTPNDLLFGRRSLVQEGAGKCRRVGNLSCDVIFESSMIRVTIDTGVALPRFIQLWTESIDGERTIAQMRSGTTIFGIRGSELKTMKIPLPPLSLQREFVAIAERADAAKSALKQSIADIEQVMKGLING